MTRQSLSRRQMVLAGVSAIAAGLLSAPGQSGDAFSIGKPLPAGENLMQEHAVLGRVLLIYENLAHRFERGKSDPANCMMSATEIIINHIQGQHERVEELIIFPVLRQANVLTDLVSVLVAQHKAGQELTDAIKTKMNGGGHKTSAGRAELAHLAQQFSQMYRPHSLREDTVIYPRMHQILTESEYVDLSARVQELESHMVHDSTLDQIIQQVDEIEIALGIHDLAKFTANVRKSNSCVI